MCKVISSTILVLFNIPLVIIGLGLVVFGALIRWNEKLLVERITPTIIEEIDDENAREAAQKLVEERITLFASYGLAIFLFGLFICVLSLCGICGVCCKSKILLGLYAAFLLVIFLALLVFTIVFGTRKHWFRDELGISYRRSITSDYHMDNNFPPNTGFTVFVNEIQRKHKCCGSFDYRDFQDNESFKRQNYKIPASCCKDIKDKECWERPTTQNSYKDTGCFEFLWSAAQSSYRIILYILIGLLLLTIRFRYQYEVDQLKWIIPLFLITLFFVTLSCLQLIRSLEIEWFTFAVISIYLLTRYSREKMQLL